ncbi:heme exporter protein CcmD [Pseudopelagicola sp. nBUS_19]
MPELGKYAETVLSAYAVSIILLAVLVWWSLRAAIRARVELEKVERHRNG